MIAPLRSPTLKTSQKMRLAHGFVASTFLEDRANSAETIKRISAWGAWFFSGWALVATIWYLISMLSWI